MVGWKLMCQFLVLAGPGWINLLFFIWCLFSMTTLNDYPNYPLALCQQPSFKEKMNTLPVGWLFLQHSYHLWGSVRSTMVYLVENKWRNLITLFCNFSFWELSGEKSLFSVPGMALLSTAALIIYGHGESQNWSLIFKLSSRKLRAQLLHKKMYRTSSKYFVNQFTPGNFFIPQLSFTHLILS